MSHAAMLPSLFFSRMSVLPSPLKSPLRTMLHPSPGPRRTVPLVNEIPSISHIAAVPYAGSGYRMEIYGREGTLVAAGEDSPQLNDVTLHGAQGNNQLTPIAVPEIMSSTTK